MNWFEDEAFWRDGYDLMFGTEAFAQAPEHVDRLLALTGMTSGAALDLCCGPGRHVIPLAERGFSVTGVDLSEFLLNRAKENACAAQVRVEFVKADMRSFTRPNAFDLVVNLSTSFGYFPDPNDDRMVLANIFDATRSGGCAVIDTNSKELMALRFRNRIVDLPNGSVCVQRINFVDEWTRVESEWIFVNGASARRHNFSHRLYSGRELRESMEAVGFNVSLFGDLDGRPYGPDATRLIAVGRKD